MKMKKPSWNSRFGNKGFAFSLDAAVAVIIFTVVLLTATYYVARSEEDMLPKLQIVRTGSDVTKILDHNGLLHSELLEDQVRDKMYDLLPPNYDMKIAADYKCICSSKMSTATCNLFEATASCSGSFSVGSEPLEDRFVASGKRFFVNITSVEFEDTTYANVFYYGEAEYRVWLK